MYATYENDTIQPRLISTEQLGGRKNTHVVVYPLIYSADGSEIRCVYLTPTTLPSFRHPLYKEADDIRVMGRCDEIFVDFPKGLVRLLPLASYLLDLEDSGNGNGIRMNEVLSRVRLHSEGLGCELKHMIHYWAHRGLEPQRGLMEMIKLETKRLRGDPSPSLEPTAFLGLLKMIDDPQTLLRVLSAYQHRYPTPPSNWQRIG